MSQIQPRNAFASYRRADLTEPIHTRKEILVLRVVSVKLCKKVIVAEVM